MSEVKTPERVRLMQVPVEDGTSFSTVSKPFKDVFSDTVFLKALTPQERSMPIFERWYKVRVVEALAGTWLSRVTYYLRGGAAAAYEPTLIGLLEGDLAGGLRRHGVVGGGSVPNFPDLHQQGRVPKGYDPTKFNPDEIYPGQRFILIDVVRVERVDFDEGTVISVPLPDSFWRDVWLGVVWGVKADGGIGGYHDAVGAVVNLGDMQEHGEVRRFGGLRVRGWRVGLGVGASSGATLVIFVNYPTLASLNVYSDDGFDWSIALGASVPRASPRLVQRLFTFVQDLRGVKEFHKTGKTGALIKEVVETLIKNLKGGIPSTGDRFRITVPVPFTGPGKHLWAGLSTSRFETFWAKEVPNDI